MSKDEKKQENVTQEEKVIDSTATEEPVKEPSIKEGFRKIWWGLKTGGGEILKIVWEWLKKVVPIILGGAAIFIIYRLFGDKAPAPTVDSTATEEPVTEDGKAYWDLSSDGSEESTTEEATATEELGKETEDFVRF